MVCIICFMKKFTLNLVIIISNLIVDSMHSNFEESDEQRQVDGEHTTLSSCLRTLC